MGRGTIYTKNYDSAGRLTAVNAGALKTALAYDQAGNITKMAREHGTYALSYDESDQLIGSNYQGKLPDQSGAWEYDLLGNRLRDLKNGVSRQVSNFLLQNEKSSFFADLDGFGETVGEKTKEESKSFSYRADGKIAGYIGNGVVAKYHYDGLDRLIAKEIQTKGGSFTQSFVHLEGETGVLLGKAGDGSITTYIDGQGAAERLGEVKGTSGKGYITDHLGSVLNTEVAGSNRSFGLWGEISNSIKVTSTSSPVSFGFTGHLVDLESGLNRTQFRQYDPKTGRWLRQDPIGLDAFDSNYYRYALNKSLLAVDPDGRFLVNVAGAALGAGLAFLTGSGTTGIVLSAVAEFINPSAGVYTAITTDIVIGMIDPEPIGEDPIILVPGSEPRFSPIFQSKCIIEPSGPAYRPR